MVKKLSGSVIRSVQHPVFWMILAVVGLSILAFSSSIQPERAVEYCEQAGCGDICSQPERSTDENAAVRWSGRQRVVSVYRWEKRSSLRSIVDSLIKPDTLSSLEKSVLLSDDSLYHNHVSLNYYRRLWQKVLPSRAGPFV